MISTSCLLKRVRNSLAVCFIVFNSLFLVPSTARAEEPAPVVTTIVTQGGDDSSYQIPLTVPVIYDGVEYQNVYATTNSVVTFGNPDGTYWTYPTTPSISIESRDWWALPTYNPEMHFIISTSEGGFQVDGAYLPYGTMQGEITSIVITAQIQTDGTVAYTYVVNGPLYGGERTGARLTDGTIVTLEEAGVTQVEQAPVLEPTPVEPTPVEPPAPEPTPNVPVEPEPSSPEPTQPVEPSPRPISNEPVQVPVEPVVDTPVDETAPVDTPTEQPSETLPEEQPVETSTGDPEPAQETVTPPVETPAVEETQPLEPPVNVVTLDNGVILSANVAQALELFNSPTAFVSAIFTNPSEAITAFLNVGADMSPDVRQKSEKVVIAAVIAGQIAQTAASVAGASAYRRKP